MTGETWIGLGTLAFLIIGGIAGASWKLLGRVEAADAAVRAELHSVETKWAATAGKYDLDLTQFREWVGNEFLRRREYEIAQQNTERRLASIETKLDRIPDSLERQSERLIAVLKETRPP